jgi:hypothetical protein
LLLLLLPPLLLLVLLLLLLFLSPQRMIMIMNEHAQVFSQPQRMLTCCYSKNFIKSLQSGTLQTQSGLPEWWR